MTPNDWTRLLADMDQGARMIAESFPPLLWGLFEGLRSQGFTDAQALRLTRDYLLAMLGKSRGDAQ